MPARVAVHAPSAGGAPDVGPQSVGVLGLGMWVGRHGIQVDPVPRSSILGGASRHELLGGEEGRYVDQRFMRWHS